MVHENTIALDILLNIDNATKHEWGSKFRTAMHTIRRQYAYNAVHNARSVVTILAVVAAADQNCNIHDAPAPNNIGPRSLAHAVDLNLLYLNVLVNDMIDDETKTYGNAYAATLNSESSADKPHRR